MAKIKLLIDTDILIDALKGMREARELFRTEDIDLYCSILNKKELFSKAGLRESERKRVENLLAGTKVLRIDREVAMKYSALVKKYGDRPGSIVDYLIAATAWAKKLPLLTRNRKHFLRMEEIALAPGYEVEC